MFVDCTVLRMKRVDSAVDGNRVDYPVADPGGPVPRLGLEYLISALALLSIIYLLSA